MTVSAEIPAFDWTRRDKAQAQLHAQLERVERLLFTGQERERRLRDQQRRLARRLSALADERGQIVVQPTGPWEEG